MTLTVAQLATVCYGIGLSAFGMFSLQLLLRPRRTLSAKLLLFATIATTAWQLNGLLFSLYPSENAWVAYQVLDAFRYGAWVAFIGSLVPGLSLPGGRLVSLSPRTWVAVGVAFAMVLGALGAVPLLGFDPFTVLGTDLLAVGFSAWVLATVIGLMLCEHLFRGTPVAKRWGIKPLCLGLLAIFGFDLFLYSDAVLLKDVDLQLLSVRGLVHALTLPLLMVSSSRNREWTVDVSVSRNLVFGTTALFLSGLYMLAVAGAGYYVRYFGGDWGRAIQATLFFVALLGLALVFFSGSMRAWLRVFISKNFFSYRYDYREEWLRFTNRLAAPAENSNIYAGTIDALGALVESPAGALWLRSEDGAFRFAGRSNMAQPSHTEPSGTPLVTFLARTGWVIDISEWSRNAERYEQMPIPEWLSTWGEAWLVIPLPGNEGLMGFIVLTQPRTPVEVNWEVLDLLKTAARQAATFLGHIRATEALVEAQQFSAFNRMSAFVVHDLKNLVAQMQLMLKNAERHAANPEFQKDMLGTVEHVVERMNRLLLQLRSGATPIANPAPVDLTTLATRIRNSQIKQGREVTLDLQSGLRAVAHEERLERVIGHLVQNAVDATDRNGEVSVRTYAQDKHAVVEVQDNGKGMTPEFVRDQLFKPFRSTKSTGMGIGAYESQQYVNELGGRIVVESAAGSGTCIRVILPGDITVAAEHWKQSEAA